jgi:hypothetical protein
MTRRLLLCAVLGGCAASTPSAELPLISPPVQAAIPSALQTSSPRKLTTLDGTLSAPQLRERFFSGAGPTDLMTILGTIDERLAEINDGGHPACLDQPAITYTIRPFGHDVALAAQCFRVLGPSTDGGVDFLQFGARNGKTTLYISVGQIRLAAIIAPIEGSTEHLVDAWYGVGYGNATSCGATGTFEDCSYAATQLYANPVTHAFEMSVAGIGVGFCGVQFASNGASIYGIGSTDMGTTCNDPLRLCVSADDLTAPGTCATPAAYVLPALGRTAGAGAQTFAASCYPGVPNITLDGTEADSLHFGPLAPTDGAGDFDAR